MELELKHLAGYLPYGLKVLDEDNTEWELDLIARNGNVEVVTEMNAGRYERDIDEIRPILRPLSDLTKKEFRKDFNEVSEHIGFDFDSYSDFAEYFTKDEHILSFHFDVIQWLIELHFDIYGLIEQGLAIDINTLNK